MQAGRTEGKGGRTEGDAGRVVMEVSRPEPFPGRASIQVASESGGAGGVGYRGRDRLPSFHFKFAVSETSRSPSHGFQVAARVLSASGLDLLTVGFRRRSPAPPWPARLRGSAECSAACRVVPVPLFLDRIPPGLSAGVGTGGRQQSRENQKERARRGGSECA